MERPDQRDCCTVDHPAEGEIGDRSTDSKKHQQQAKRNGVLADRAVENYREVGVDGSD